MKTAAELQVIAQARLCQAKTDHAEFLAYEMSRIETACEENAGYGQTSYRHIIEPNNTMYNVYGNKSEKMLSAMLETKLRALGYRTVLYYSAGGFHLAISW